MIYTVGHSTLSLVDFIKVIEDVEHLVDIRSHPTSRWPQFMREELARSMQAYGKRYTWLPELGGWDVRHALLIDEMASHGVDLHPYLRGHFPKQRIAEERSAERSPAWTNQGLYDFQWYMTLPSFHSAVQQLLEFARRTKVAIMCAELLWWKCHRSMVADYLVWMGQDAIHLQPRLTAHSHAIGTRLMRYEPEVRANWQASVKK